MRADERDIQTHAHRLAESLEDRVLYELDPGTAIEQFTEIRVRYRADVDSDCDIDGSYDRRRKLITVAESMSKGRRRFTTLHEYAHVLVRSDGEINDWLRQFGSNSRLVEERVANAFAGEVLVSTRLLDQYVPDRGPDADSVVQLSRKSQASREAVCVRVAQRLRGAGLVAVGEGSTIRFAASNGMPFGIPRDSNQRGVALFDRAAQNGAAREDGVRLRLPSGLSSAVNGDARSDERGYIFVVLMRGRAPWQRLTPVSSGPIGAEIDCADCDEAITVFAAECHACGDRPCPIHGCSCERRRRAAKTRHCARCNSQLPTAAPRTQDLCDLCA